VNLDTLIVVRICFQILFMQDVRLGSNPGRVNWFSLLHTCPDQPWGYSAVMSLTGAPRGKYRYGCLRGLIIKGLKSVRMKRRERAHLINITNKTPDNRVTLKNRMSPNSIISFHHFNILLYSVFLLSLFLEPQLSRMCQWVKTFHAIKLPCMLRP
jgi:hypothetical protein